MKRGVMELADLVAVNKADGTNLKAAERARGEAAECFALLSRHPVRMDTARAHLFGTNRNGDLRALELRSRVHGHDKSQWLVRPCTAQPDTEMDA